ncbi:MAG: RidA family protein [Woeseiaceae bacterium]|jgi:enamine deaminase RidA (YjgF/YER057c/UK114 family)|tara:strand:- start:263 stop:751 length:489 start_codon:yes stop_codon:yes gene_type:complete
MKKFIFSLFIALLSVNLYADVTRHALPNNSTFPISRAVEVTPDTTIIYHSGQLPSPANPDAERGSREWAGDTEAQTMSVLKKFENSFKSLGVDFGDAVKLTVFLVGDPELDGRMDFSGFMRSYSKFFGTEEQPNKPARSAVQIEALAGGWLVEIEMVLAKPK